MQSIRTFGPLLRAILVISVVAALVTSITFAALESSATLTGSTVSSATASLLVDGDEDATFGSSEAGFTFSGVVPGGSAAPEPAETFDLKNDGGVDFDIYVSIPTAPTTSGAGTIDLSKVSIVLSCTDSDGAFAVTDSIQNLVDAHATGGVNVGGDAFGAGDTADCDIQASMELDAITGQDATVDAFDLEFLGSNTAEAS